MYFCITLLVSVAACICSIKCQETLDTLEPIVKISPAKAAGQTADRFGFSVTAHRLEDISSNDTLKEILGKTTIIVGAPLGLFPGGITGLEYGDHACPGNTGATQEQREACFNEDFNSTGLVYQCGLDNADCGALIGNGMANSADGYLFERSGNDPDIITTSISTENGEEIKNDQQMGFKLMSSDGFFVACAPMWKHEGAQPGPQPRGRCVYSGRSLDNFKIMLPCITGNRLNQNQGGYCSTGMGISIKSEDDNTVQIALGTPGRYFSRGGLSYYADAANMSISDGYRKADVPPSVGGGDVVGRREYDNTPPAEGTVGYYGVAIGSGHISSPDGPTQFLVGAPHLDRLTLIGKVFILPFNNSYFQKPTQFIQGEQFSELFGYSVLVLDLNNDGYDDAVIGAPLYYERERPELGRLHIFENDKNGSFRNSTKIVGRVFNSRFGLSLTALGDLNDDGYNDFAVGAPFEEGSGAVYIYYGQPRDSEDRIVNPQYAQRIDGKSFVDKVSNLTEVDKFGFSISGNVDVDNNQYNDLVIGAYGSQAVFVLRSRPYARVVADLSSVNEVQLLSYGCELDGLLYSCFTVSLCASYSGKGIAEQFTTMIVIEEVSRPRRLQFSTDATPSSKTTSITFNGVNVTSCANITAYIRNGTTSLEEFELSGRVLNIDRADVVVDTTTTPSDLSALPYIQSEPLSLLVGVFAECGPDDVCVSNLQIRVQNITYRTRNGGFSTDQDSLVVDDVQQVYITTLFSNAEEDAFNSFVTFSVPKKFFTYEQAFVDNRRINCIEMNSNDSYDNRRCNVLSPLSKSRGDADLTIRLTVANNLFGNEGSTSVPISIMVGENSTRNNEPSNTLMDNSVSVDIPISARSLYTVSVAFNPNFESYQGNHTPVVNDIVNDLGEFNRLTTTFRNVGPTAIRNAVLNIYVPTRSDATGDFYFYYPFSAVPSDDSVSCTTRGFNPKEYREVIPGSGTRRRRRSTQRRLSDGNLGLIRFGRQSDRSLNVNCESNREECAMVTCNITGLGLSAVDIVVTGYLDERFYNGKTEQYLLLAHAESQVLEDYYNTDGSRTSDNSTLSLSIESRAMATEGIPWYVIAVPIIAAIVFFVVLVIALYYFGILRRKSKVEKPGGEDEFDQFDSNPFGKGAGPPPPAIGASLGDPQLTSYDEKKEKF